MPTRTGGAAIMTRNHVVEAKDPISQATIAGSVESGSATNCTSETSAVNIAATTTPASTTVMVSLRPSTREMKPTSSSAMTPKAKADADEGRARFADAGSPVRRRRPPRR